MEIVDRDNKRTLISVIATVLFHGLILLLLYAMGLKYPDPPPTETGVVMDVGSLEDDGNAMIGEIGGSDASNPINEFSEGSENYVAQNTDDVAITSKNTTKPNNKPTTNQTTQANQEETLNPNALFQKGKVKNTGSGQGTGKGDGIGDGNNGGGGTGTDGTGSGHTFSLAGRGSKSLGIPPSKTDEVGTVVVKIWVNPEGDVVRAVAGSRGTTIDNKLLWRNCEIAARNSKFSASPTAPEMQIGFINYKFRR